MWVAVTSIARAELFVRAALSCFANGCLVAQASSRGLPKEKRSLNAISAAAFSLEDRWCRARVQAEAQSLLLASPSVHRSFFSDAPHSDIPAARRRAGQ